MSCYFYFVLLHFLCCSASGFVCLVEVFSVGGGALLDRLCMVFQRMCMLCL